MLDIILEKLFSFLALYTGIIQRPLKKYCAWTHPFNWFIVQLEYQGFILLFYLLYQVLVLDETIKLLYLFKHDMSLHSCVKPITLPISFIINL